MIIFLTYSNLFAGHNFKPPDGHNFKPPDGHNFKPPNEFT